MGKVKQWMMAALLLMAQGAWAQESTEEPSLTLTEIRKMGDCTVYAFNYPSGGEQADYVGRCIVIAPDYEGYGVTKDIPHPYLSQRVTAQQMIDGVKYGLELQRSARGGYQCGTGSAPCVGRQLGHRGLGAEASHSVLPLEV